MTGTFITVLNERSATVSAALAHVREREEAVRSEYAEKLREISEEATRLEAELRHIGALLALQGGAPGKDTEQAAFREELPMPADLREETCKLLGEVREPMHYTRITQELALRGIHIPGKEPQNNLVAHIHKDPRFKRPKRGFYGLAEWYPKDSPSVGARRPKTGRQRRAPKTTKEVSRQ